MRPKGLPIALVAVVGLMMLNPVRSSFAQSHNENVTIPGTLELVDKPPSVTPVEFLMVTIQPPNGGYRFDAQPDHGGNFTVKDVPPGRYSLHLPFPCRVRTFAIGSRALPPDAFEIMAGESGPLRIVVSLKTAALSVDISGIPDNDRTLFAVVYPADPYLMPPDSGIGNPVSGHQTQYRFLTPGKYTLFVADEGFKWALTSPAVRSVLKDKATAVEMRDDGETKVTATYITPDAIRAAITAANWQDPREIFEKQPRKAKQQ